MLQLVLEGGSLVRPLHILSPVHWVGVEPMTLRDETSGRTTTPVESNFVQIRELQSLLLPENIRRGTTWQKGLGNL